MRPAPYVLHDRICHWPWRCSSTLSARPSSAASGRVPSLVGSRVAPDPFCQVTHPLLSMLLWFRTFVVMIAPFAAEAFKLFHMFPPPMNHMPT